MSTGIKHENYEILNLIGYGLAKFDVRFVKQFGCKTKTEFYEVMVKLNSMRKCNDLIEDFLRC
jgi:hypothetical protein